MKLFKITGYDERFEYTLISYVVALNEEAAEERFHEQTNYEYEIRSVVEITKIDGYEFEFK